jgi:hypothetical protein
LISSFALAWATSHSNGSRTEIGIKPLQPRSLHAKSASVNRQHRAPAGHHAGKRNAKLHGGGQQSGQNGFSQTGHSRGGKHGGHPRSDTTPTPTPEEVPTATPGLTPGSNPMANRGPFESTDVAAK